MIHKQARPSVLSHQDGLHSYVRLSLDQHNFCFKVHSPAGVDKGPVTSKWFQGVDGHAARQTLLDQRPAPDEPVAVEVRHVRGKLDDITVCVSFVL